MLEQVAEKQTIHIGELAVELGVSEMTIRRDITRLERDGFLRRTYGGATAHITRSMELLFNARALANAAAKRLIGMRAAQMVGQATTICVGIGSTTEQFAMFLPPRDDLMVITGSLPVASMLGSRRGRVVVLGGSILPDELACIGPVATATARRFNADLAVMGAAGVSAARGITELDHDAAEVQRTLIEQSARLLVLADGSKIGEVAMATVAAANTIGTLVTDESAPAEALEALGATGIELVVVRGRANRSAHGRAPEDPAP